MINVFPSEITTEKNLAETNRAAYLRAGIINSAYLRGESSNLYFNPTTMSTSVLNADKVVPSRNILLPPAKRLKAYLLGSLPSLRLAPDKIDDKTLLQSKKGTKLLECLHKTLELQAIYSEVVDTVIPFGVAFVKCVFDKNKGIQLDDNTSIGDIAVTVCQPDTIIIPNDKIPVWIIEEKTLVLGEAEQIYCKKVANRDKETKVKVLEYYSDSTWKNPKGRYIVTIDGEVVADKENPYLYPFARIFSPFVMFSFGINHYKNIYVTSLITLCRPQQKRYNLICEQIYKNIRNFANIKWMLPGITPLKEMQLNNGQAEVFQYNPALSGAPQQAMLQSLPSHVLVTLDRLRLEVEDLLSNHTIKFQARPRTAQEVSLMLEEDASSLSPDITSFHSSLCRVGKLLLLLARKGYTEKRLFAGGFEVLGEELSKEINVDIQVGSALSLSILGRREQVRQDLSQGLFDDRPGAREVRKMLYYNTAADDAFMDDEILDQEFAMHENEEMKKGNVMEVRDIDTHEYHLPVHIRWAKQLEFLKLDTTVQALAYIHIQKHKDDIAAKQQEIAMLAQQNVAGGVKSPTNGGDELLRQQGGIPGGLEMVEG